MSLFYCILRSVPLITIDYILFMTNSNKRMNTVFIFVIFKSPQKLWKTGLKIFKCPVLNLIL